MNWIDVAQDMGWVLGACEHGHKPSTSMNHRELTDLVQTTGFLQRTLLNAVIKYNTSV